MGCPAKKVCKRAAGSALLRDEALVASILDAVVNAVSVPVTLKMRTGWCADTRNAVVVGRLAESAGVQALALHGRTRACGFQAPVEYDTIAALVSSVRIPVIANGDIATPEQANRVMQYTGAAAVMIGRAVQGQPWLLREICSGLAGGRQSPVTSAAEKWSTMLRHLATIHDFYGEVAGVKFARKHLAWYAPHIGIPQMALREFHQLDSAIRQQEWLEARHCSTALQTGFESRSVNEVMAA